VLLLYSAVIIFWVMRTIFYIHSLSFSLIFCSFATFDYLFFWPSTWEIFSLKTAYCVMRTKFTKDFWWLPIPIQNCRFGYNFYAYQYYFIIIIIFLSEWDLYRYRGAVYYTLLADFTFIKCKMVGKSLRGT
jgi:hypothetical protein